MRAGEPMTGRVSTTIAVALGPALAATAFTRLFAGFAWWYGPILVSVIVAAATMALPRFIRISPAVHVAGGAVALLLMVTILCAPRSAIGGVIPTPDTIADLVRLLGDGRRDVSRLAAPVPRRNGLLLLLVLAMYLVTVAVDALAVRLARPTLAGLPLLALVVFPAALLPSAGIGLVPFVLGAAGYLALLLQEGRATVGGWGHHVGRGPRPRVPVGAAGAGIGVVALGLAVAVPFALSAVSPGGSSRLYGSGPFSGGGRAAKTSTTVEPPMVTMTQQLHDARAIPLLRVITTRPQYLRLTALEDFDGVQFTLGRLNATKDDEINRGLPAIATTTPTTTVTSSVRVAPQFAEHYLPLPGTPRSMSKLSGDWRMSTQTGTVFSVGDTSANKNYTVRTVVPNPSRTELEAQRLGPVPGPITPDAQVPTTVSPRVRALARTVTAGATTQFDKALKIQDYLRSSLFTYDLTGAPTNSQGALDAFLFSNRRGYCEQFATAMAVMLRTLGIPTRIAVGFSPGTPLPDGSYLVTNHDAHAWPEVWFPRSGWVTFEPTPAPDRGVNPPPYADAASSLATPAPAPQPAATATPAAGAGAPTPRATAPALKAPAPITVTGHGGGGGGWPSILVVLLILALLALGAVPAVVRARLRGRRLRPEGPGRGRGPAPEVARAKVHAAWSELVDAAVDLGWPIGPQESPRAYAARLAANLGPERTRDPEAGVDGVARTETIAVGGPNGSPGAAPRAEDRPGRGAGRARRPGRRSGPTGSRPPGRSGSDRVRRGTGADGRPAVPGVREAVTRLGSAEENARYAPSAMLAGLDGSGLSKDVRLVARGLRAQTSPTRRVWATIAPKSVLATFGSRARSGMRSLRANPRRRGSGVAGSAAVRARRGLPTDGASAPRDVR